MPRDLPEYHQRVADQNRAAVIAAATALFLERGYDGTSLARVADRAGVSKATLFKQFPSKSALFEATVLAVGGQDRGRIVDVPPVGDPHAGLLALGRAYADILTHPRTADLIRLVIAEAPRFPDLRERTFNFGTLPALAALGRYLRAEQDAGNLVMDAPDVASEQFLGMIASSIFWPRLVHATWSITGDEIRRVIEEAVRTIVARYATSS